MKDGFVGEGLVIKNYDYIKSTNNSVPWKKLVLDEFRVRAKETFKNDILHKKEIEERIVEDFVTYAFIKKEYAKILLSMENEGRAWTNKNIPELLGKIFYEFIQEESFSFVKKYKYPIVNFKKLLRLTQNKIKETLPEVFNN